mmetsp:Transcript_1166/g.3222  ORF Transcript_1166/g.3222 Transcript_1166/m.3222 type:complete len:112 (-) Transcript_1166:1966-2301(-)
MATVSWSGVLTLAFILLAGPACYLFLAIYRRVVKAQKAKLSESARSRSQQGEERENRSSNFEDGASSEREEWSYSQYLFGLIGYAIGLGNVWRFCYVIARVMAARRRFWPT